MNALWIKLKEVWGTTIFHLTLTIEKVELPKNVFALRKIVSFFKSIISWSRKLHRSYITLYAVVILSYCILFVVSQGVKSVTVPTNLCVWSMGLCTPSLTGRWCPRPVPACLWSSTSTASWVGYSQKDVSRSAHSLVPWRRLWFLRVNCKSTTFIWR